MLKMTANAFFDLPEHLAAEIFPFLELRDFVRLDTATCDHTSRSQLSSLYHLHCIHDKENVKGCGLSWFCRKGIEMRNVQLNSNDLLIDTLLLPSRENLLALCNLNLSVDKDYVDNAISFLERLHIPMKKLTVDYLSLFSGSDNVSRLIASVMRADPIIEHRIFRRTFDGIEKLPNPAILYESIAQDANMIINQAVMTSFGKNYMEFTMNLSCVLKKPFNSLSNVEVDLMQKYPLLETAVQNAHMLLTFSAKGPNCGYLFQIQSNVLQELALLDVCYQPPANEEEIEMTATMTALPSSFVQWIAQLSPFCQSLQRVHLSSMKKADFPSRHYRCLASLPQLKSLSLENVEYDAADIEFVLDHAPATLKRISLQECESSTCSYGIRLLTQNKYEAVTILCSAESLAEEMNTYLCNLCATGEHKCGKMMIQSRLRELDISFGQNAVEANQYLLTLLEENCFRHLNVLKLNMAYLSEDRLEMIAAHCPLLDQLFLFGYGGVGGTSGELICLSSFPQLWKRLKIVTLLGNIAFNAAGVESVVSCSTVIRHVTVIASIEAFGDMVLKARLQDRYSKVKIVLIES